MQQHPRGNSSSNNNTKHNNININSISHADSDSQASYPFLVSTMISFVNSDGGTIRMLLTLAIKIFPEEPTVLVYNNSLNLFFILFFAFSSFAS